jgi:hypothetical protein
VDSLHACCLTGQYSRFSGLPQELLLTDSAENAPAVSGLE